MKNNDNNGYKSLWLTTHEIQDKPFYIAMGDLELTVSRLSREWRISYKWVKQGNEGQFSGRFIDRYCETEGISERLALESMTASISLKPKLADRSVIVRPYAPLTIPGQNMIQLYISTPLWLHLEFSAFAGIELPVQQLSETWMGSLAGDGELCYGSHTHARLERAQLLRLPFRALTPATIRNKGTENFTLERLSIPTTYLSLYEGEEQLVTESLTFIMEPENHLGTMEMGPAESVVRLAEPRKKTDKGILVNAWEKLFA